MSEQDGDSPEQAAAAEFSKHFWAARKEHVRLEEGSTAIGPAHQSAVEFAKKQGWAWAESLLEGSRLTFTGAHESALALLEQIKSSVPSRWSGAFQLVLGRALVGAKKHDEAIEALRSALNDPNFDSPGNAWNNLGIALSEKGDLDEAIKAYRKAIEDPNYETPAKAWFNLGNAMRSKGDDDEAIKAYRMAIEDPNYETPAKAWTNLGTVLRTRGEIEEAIKAYRKALEYPNIETPGFAWYNLANALRSQGDDEEAIKAYRKALEDPKFEPAGYAWNNLGNALRDTGKHEEAIEAYRKALEDPKYKAPARARTNLANLLVTLNRGAEARQEFQKVLDTTDPTGGDHARAKRGLQLLDAEINPQSLSPADRAVLAPASAADTGISEIEQGIVDAIDKAGGTQYDKYLEKFRVRKEEETRNDTLSILRGWSSAVTLTEGSARRWRGGGYFIRWRNYGIVIDPGLDFLRNFHDADYHGCDIHVVIVSHNHPDHNSDLKAVDDLQYEMYTRLKANGRDPYIIMWDRDTELATTFVIENPEHRCETVTLNTGLTGPIDLSTRHKQKIPIRVHPFRVEHAQYGDVPYAVGMRIELLDPQNGVAMTIGYTADTGYFADLSQQLQNCDVLIAHISQPRPTEFKDASQTPRKIHLGYWGTIKLLKECKPTLALIGEFWAGFDDLRIPLVKGLQVRSGITQVLPTGIGMHIQLPSLKIECKKCGKYFAKVKIAPPADEYGNLAYLCENCTIG